MLQHNQSICYHVATRNKRTSAKMFFTYDARAYCDRVTTTFAKMIFTTTIPNVFRELKCMACGAC